MIEFPYNDLGKFKSYRLDFGEDIWSCKEFETRRIVIKKKYKKGDQEYFYQSILTNETGDAGDIIRRMLNRSKQELDFKKQKAHHGLDGRSFA